MCKHLQYLAFLFKSGCLHKCWHKPKIWIETWNTNIWLLIQTVYKIIHCITWHDITLPCIALHYKTWDCIALQTHCLIFNLCSSVLHVMYLCVYTYIYICIYTANAWALPGTATTTGNASSASSSSSSSSSSSNPYWRSSMKVEVQQGWEN